MCFKFINNLLASSLLLILSACSDTSNETQLANLFTAASFDIVSISFPVNSTQDVISINAFFDFTIEGLLSNNVDTITINDNIVWSLSAGVNSTINQSGRITSSTTAETVTVTAQVGHLTVSRQIFVSAAKFDRVIQLNSTAVNVNICQTAQIIPIGSYLNDDGSEEQRPVDSTIINSIVWLIRNQEDGSSSQRALISTTDNITELQGHAVGNVIIQAQATSVSTGNSITSIDFDQTIDNNLQSLKLCLNSNTDLSACTLTNNDIVVDNVVSLMAVGTYQASDGSDLFENISAYSKWGIDNTNNASIALSSDRQQLNITGTLASTSANISAACGAIEQAVTNVELNNGVVLLVPVSCATNDTDCITSTAAMNIIEDTVESLTVTANAEDLESNIAFVLPSQPTTISLIVTANFVNNDNTVVTDDINVAYVIDSSSTNIITEVVNSPGEYTVESAGDAEISITYKGQSFVAIISIPN